MLIQVNATNDGRFVEASETVSIGVLASSFGNITAQKDGEGLLQSISRTDGRTETFLIRNDGNAPLDGDITVVVLDKDGMERKDWAVSVEPSTVSGLAIGESLEVEVTLLPSDDVERGTGQLLLNLTTSEGQTTTFEEVVSVEISEGSTGLFNILPPAASGAIVAALVIGGVVLARRMKKSGELEDDSTSLVAPNTHANPDMLGERREEALDLGSAVDELTSGEVSDEEIAQAIMQSMDLPSMPAAVPQGLPPSGMPPSLVPKACPLPACRRLQGKRCPSIARSNASVTTRSRSNSGPGCASARPTPPTRRSSSWLDHGTVAALWSRMAEPSRLIHQG